MTLAIIGAGLSGLAAARHLAQHGHSSILFEKSRGPGGRCATRRSDPAFAFDHGAQYFTARHPAFLSHVHSWAALGLVAPWPGRIVQLHAGSLTPKADQPTRYVAVPSMSALGRHLAADLPLHLHTQIVHIQHAPAGWHLRDDQGHSHGPFAQLLLTLPAPQAATLLADHPFATQARSVSMVPCWAALLAFEQPLTLPFDGAFVHDSPLAWLARNSSKPGRPATPDCWTLHATAEWSRAHLDLPRETVASALLHHLQEATRTTLPPTIHLDAHRWLYSVAAPPLEQFALFDEQRQLAVCGDWLAGNRIEGAFLSGLTAAHRLRGLSWSPGPPTTTEGSVGSTPPS